MNTTGSFLLHLPNVDIIAKYCMQSHILGPHLRQFSQILCKILFLMRPSQKSATTNTLEKFFLFFLETCLIPRFHESINQFSLERLLSRSTEAERIRQHYYHHHRLSSHTLVFHGRWSHIDFRYIQIDCLWFLKFWHHNKKTTNTYWKIMFSFVSKNLFITLMNNYLKMFYLVYFAMAKISALCCTLTEPWHF